MLAARFSIFLALLPLVTASALHRAIPGNAVLAQEQPLITPSPSSWDPTKTEKFRRGIISDIGNDIGGVLSELGSNIPSYVASGVPNFFQGFPTGDGVKSSLGIKDDEVAALPTQVLNLS